MAKNKREAPIMLREAEPRAVEVWLRQDLKRRYADVLQEALPQEWLALLEASKPH